MLILKIFRRPEWDAFRAAGETLGAPVDLAAGGHALDEAVVVFGKLSLFRMSSFAGEPRQMGGAGVLAMLLIQAVAGLALLTSLASAAGNALAGEDLRTYVQKELVKWEKLIEQAGIQKE